ncbi:MAG TPA: GNAT family N-acetyltransferase [Streptosporangiaceae bacterium]|nr:GNAT family N-acetyltransferase [Streptosporangiaceae bacterium]
MDIAEVLAAFDEQLRRNPKMGPGITVERDEQVTRILDEAADWSGVIWSDLTEDTADAVIAAQVARLGRDCVGGDCVGAGWEWKHYSYDQPADLPARLLAAGFVPEPPETLLVAEIAELDLRTPPPVGIDLVPVTGRAGADAMVAVHDEVFGGSGQRIADVVLGGIADQPPSVAAVIAMAGQTPVSAGRVEFPPGGDFASIWSGGTLPAWRGRGIFRSLVAHRAALAADRGYRYLQVDALPDSRPILRRLGFAELATTTPYLYQAVITPAAGH